MGLNILDSVTYYDVNLNKVDDEIKKKMEEDFGTLDTELPDSDWLNMTLHDIDRYGIDSSAIKDDLIIL